MAKFGLNRNLLRWGAGLAFVFATISSGVAHALPEGIDVSLRALYPITSGDKAVELEITYFNASNDVVSLLKSETALEGSIKADFLDVTINGLRLPYQGPIFKQLPPGVDDYIWLQPGEARNAIVSVDLAYAMTYAGDYKIAYKDDQQNKAASKQTVTITLRSPRPFYKQTPNFRTCNETERSRLNSALSTAESLAGRARNDLRTTPVELRPQADRYREWFGSYDLTRWNKVQTNFDRIFSTASGRTITFDCNCTQGTSTTLAYVYPNSPYNIYICPLFWSRPASSGADSKAGIIIHEISHFTIVSDTDDVVYGTSGSRNLANTNPSAAVRNADSYEYFAENPFGRSMPRSGDGNPPSDPDPDPTPTPEPPRPDPEPEPEPDYAYISPILALALFDEGGELVTAPPEPEPVGYPELPELQYVGGVLRVRGEQDEQIVGDRTLDLHSASANFHVQDSSGDPGYLYFSIRGDSSWSLRLGRPYGDNRPLSVGRYANAVGTPFNSERPRISFSGDGRSCGDSTGEFTVHQIEYDANNNLVKLHANFLQRCDHRVGVAKGSILFDSTLPAWPPTVLETPTGEPYPALPNKNAPGLTLAVEDPSGYFMPTSTILLNSTNSSFSTSTLYGKRGLSFSVRANDAFWSLSFAGSRLYSNSNHTELLSVGVYNDALNTHSLSLGNNLSFATPDRNCLESQGRFRIFEIEYDESDQLQRLVADFYSYCGLVFPAFGSIAYNRE